MDGIELEIFWSNLISIVTEQAKALQRIAFSPDRPRSRRPGQRRCSIRAWPHGGAGDHRARRATSTRWPHLRAKKLTERSSLTGWSPGDVVITNDPWLSAGHFFDITVFSPVFNGRPGDRLSSARTIHHTDIGGYGIGAGARDVHEEGLWIPPVQAVRKAGVPNALLHDIIRHNVRVPDYVFGDLAAQVSSGRTGSERLLAFCQRSWHGRTSRRWPTRSSPGRKQATRRTIRRPAGRDLARRKPVRRAGRRHRRPCTLRRHHRSTRLAG